jgi:Flp pilus assembly protein TadG
MALCIILFLGMAGLTVDIGHAFISYRQLQTSTDAAALAAGTEMASSTANLLSVQNAAASYSSASGKTIVGANVDTNMLPGVTVTTTPLCLAKVTWVNCGATVLGNYNAVQVSQTMTAPTVFMKAMNAFGIKTAGSIPLTTVAYASMLGSANTQYNVALIIDTTGSAGNTDPDANCTVTNSKGKQVSGTELDCASQGAAILLNSLTPCGGNSTSTTCASAFDTVALFTFPNVSYNTVAGDYSCTTTTPKSVAYSVPSKTGTTYSPSGTQPTYEVTFGAGSPASSTGFLDDYSTTNAYNGGISTTSPWGIALGLDSGKNCTGLQSTGGQGTYLAGAVYAAMGALIAAQKANSGSQNALIILSDGDAPGTGSGTGAQSAFTDSTGKTVTMNNTGATVGAYPSQYDECAQAVAAAQAATTAGITVYTVAYNAPTSGGCANDVKGTLNTNTGANPNGTNIQPCTELQQMATNSGDFYSDATTANKGACTSSVNPNLTLDQVFKSVATKFTRARLVPN